MSAVEGVSGFWHVYSTYGKQALRPGQLWQWNWAKRLQVYVAAEEWGHLLV